MVRDGMTHLIQMVRELAHAGTADHTLGGVTYWTDEQIQAELDRTAVFYKDEALELKRERIGGQWVYLDYAYPFEYVERAATEGAFVVRDRDGATVTDFTVNYDARIVRFTADTGGKRFYLSAREYSPHLAAAAIWERKAAFYEAKVDFRTDNHQIAASQQVAHCHRMAAQMRRKAGIQSVMLFRADER